MADRPNLLFIFTDQQNSRMMSCTGNRYLHTPAMDSLAASGVRFDRAYCTSPVCIPSRFSLMTGRMPSEIRLRSNEIAHIGSIPQNILNFGLGTLLRKAGYEVAYGGKVHLPNMRSEDVGFETICTDERDNLADECANFIKKERKKPFFLVASFINPHDICYMAIRDFNTTEHSRKIIDEGHTELATLDKALQLPKGISEKEFFDNHCPPLPENHEPQKDEPEAINWYLELSPFKKLAREKYTDKQWRLHKWAYCRLTEMVDSQIARVLEALRANRQEQNTVVVFSSDHGDLDSAHKLEHKTVFYEEACRVPFIISQPGVTLNGVNSSLISNGLDLLPTLCDYADIEPPSDLAGISLRSLTETESSLSREFIPMESQIGRMIVTGEYKYMLYDNGKNQEQLIDLKRDPGETKNCAIDPAYAGVIKKYRDIYTQHFGSELVYN